MKMLVNTVPPIISKIAPAVASGPLLTTRVSPRPELVIVCATSNAAPGHVSWSPKWKNASAMP